MRSAIFVILLFVFVQVTHAQYNMDYGISLGASNYVGEVGGKDKPARGFLMDMKMSQTKFAAGAWFRYKVHPLAAAKLDFRYLRISGADSLSTYAPRKERNLHFRNDIFELTLRVEYHFYSAQDITSRGKTRIDFGAYAFLGGGGFYHNPKAFYGTKWVALQPLGTEGQGRIEKVNKKGQLKPFKKYSRIQGNVLGGFGITYTIKRKWRIGVEATARKTFTDYLDDVGDRYVDASVLDDGTEEGAMAVALSNRSGNNLNYGGSRIRGNPDKKDWYMDLVLTAGYVVRGKSNFYRSKYKFITGAKKRRKRKTRAKF